MKVRLIVDGKNHGIIELDDGITGTELARMYGAPPPVTLMKINGKFRPLPEKIKEGDVVELIITSSSG